jgi:hypothetical protein
VIVKWVAPGYGSARITGSAFDTDLGNTPTGNNAIFTILKNGTDQLYQYTVVNLDSTGQAYDVTTTIAAGDYIYFKVTPVVSNNWASISMNPVIIYSPQPQEEEEITTSNFEKSKLPQMRGARNLRGLCSFVEKYGT